MLGMMLWRFAVAPSTTALGRFESASFLSLLFTPCLLGFLLVTLQASRKGYEAGPCKGDVLVVCDRRSQLRPKTGKQMEVTLLFSVLHW